MKLLAMSIEDRVLLRAAVGHVLFINSRVPTYRSIIMFMMERSVLKMKDGLNALQQHLVHLTLR